MTTSIKVIKFSWKTCAVLCVLTYLVSLNKSYGLFDLRWLSNDFLLTIVGGAFASMLVVLLCEIQKYLQTKKETEALIYYHVGFVYGQLVEIKTYLQRKQQNCSEEVHKEIIAQPAQRAKDEIDSICSIDFVTYCAKNEWLQEHKKFCTWLRSEFTAAVCNYTYLPIAVNTDHIENLKKTGYQGRVTSTSKNTKGTIEKLLKQTESLIQQVDTYMNFMSRQSGENHNWALEKLAVDMVMDIEFGELDDFLKEEATT